MGAHPTILPSKPDSVSDTMKLATYKDGSRDGQLIVVSRDLSSAHFATGHATRMQQLLDDLNFLSPQLEDLYATLNDGKARHAFARASAPWLSLRTSPSVARRALRRATSFFRTFSAGVP